MAQSPLKVPSLTIVTFGDFCVLEEIYSDAS